jgi:hypothetical protein
MFQTCAGARVYFGMDHRGLGGEGLTSVIVSEPHSLHVEPASARDVLSAIHRSLQ